jgi:hypothetical protein
MAQLSGAQTSQLQEALLAAFDAAELAQMVNVALGEDLESIAGGGARAAVVFNLIQWAERRERVGDLVRAAQAQRPQNGVFAELARTLGGTTATAAPQPPAAVPPGAPGGISIGKIEAANVGETQIIDQRGATFNLGSRTEINTGGGAYIGGSVNTGGGSFTGRDSIVYGSADLDAALAPVVDAIRQHAGAAAQVAALEQVAALKQELAKGKEAGDSRVAGILDGLANLVPGAVAAVAGAFGTPLLSGMAGPVTQFVLEQLKRRGGIGG